MALAVGVISATALSALTAALSVAPRITGHAVLAVRASARGSLDPSETASTSALSAFFFDLAVFLFAADPAKRGSAVGAAETLGARVCTAVIGAGTDADAATAESRDAVGLVEGGWGMIADVL